MQHDCHQLHAAAGELAAAAAQAHDAGRHDDAAALFRQAFDKASAAAEMVRGEDAPEPSRSALHCQAAQLALDTDQPRVAERLAARALAGEPPPATISALREILEQIQLQRQLELREIKLDSAEFQMSLSGSSVGLGMIAVEYITDRITLLRRLIHRTAERLLARPFEDRVAADVVRNHPVFVSTVRGSGYTVSVRIGRPGEPYFKTPDFEFSTVVIGELFDCLAILDSAGVAGLQRHISDASYFRNFVALAQKLAPDGRHVTSLGFTAVSGGQQRAVSFRRPQRQIRQARRQAEDEDWTPRTITVTGRLVYADSLGKTDKIKLIESKTDVSHLIYVPDGMMLDIVRPLWDEIVVVTGEQYRHGMILDDIRSVNG